MKKLIAVLLLLGVSLSVAVRAEPRNGVGVFAEKEQRSGVGTHTLGNFYYDTQKAFFTQERVGVGCFKRLFDGLSIEGSMGLVTVTEATEETYSMPGYALKSSGTFWRVGLWCTFD